MGNWIHRFFNPHCPECAHDRVCPSCEILREQLATANYEREKLLNIIIEKNRPESVSTLHGEEKSIKPTFIPWRARQQMLEAEDREKARILRTDAELNKKSTEELEKELGVVDAKGS